MANQLKISESSYDFYYWNSSGRRSGSVSKYEALRRSRSWTRTANYKSINRSLLTTMGYTDSLHEQRIGSPVVSFPTNGGCKCNVMLPSALNTPALDDATCTSLFNDCIGKAAEKAGGYTFDLGVAAAEAKKTSEMMFKAASTLVSAARDVRKFNFRRAAKTLGIGTPSKCKDTRSFESNWLEYRYGWRTLMMDCDGAVKALAEGLVAKPPVIVVKATAKTVSTSQAGPARQGVAGGLGYEDAIVTRIYDHEWTASLTYRFTVKNTYLSGANSLGLVNLQSLAWELVPMSFVVDWFVNVGDVLRNMTSFYGKELLDGTKCLSHQIVVTSSADNYRTKVSNYPLVYASGSGATAYSYAKSRAFSRTKINTFLNVMPRLNISLNTNRAIDAGALLRQYFRR